ncbi:MAG: O-antigen ligase family protein, partial [Chloroflexota bacterium]
MIPRRVWLAVGLAFAVHGALILAGRYHWSYDAYIHIFFGDHYANDWRSLWDARWYAGFTVVSYPPLVHQLIGLFSRLIGLDAAFALILWATLSLYPLAVYSFSRVFLGPKMSGLASLGAAFLPSLYLSAHIFGQLPFLFSTMIALFGAASLSRYLKEGGIRDLAFTLALTSTAMAAHHATLLVQPFLFLTVALPLLPRRSQTDPARGALVSRLLLFGALFAAFGLLVIWPFWEWGGAQTMQVPIDHPSRHNFISDPLAILLFFVPMYGPLAFLLPFAFSRHLRLLGLSLSFLTLFLLGLGDTTPLPRLLFGPGWAWLTYDRFALWASLLFLPFLGIAIFKLRRRISPLVIFGALAVASLIVGLVTAFVPLQPGQVDMQEVVRFLAEDDRSDYRYLTFGFGDQLALLSTLTPATTMDGSYHTARTLPVLRESGIAQIDTALWFPNGLRALDPILQESSRYGVRWGFVNVPQYVPVLQRNGWEKIETLRGGVQVWENPKAVKPEPFQPPEDPLSEFSWGTFPLLALAATLALGAARLSPARTEAAFRRAHSFAAGLIPLSICFWYYRAVGEFSHPGVYFAYDNALFYLSDALVGLAVLSWTSIRINNLPWRTVIARREARKQSPRSRGDCFPSTPLRTGVGKGALLAMTRTGFIPPLLLLVLATVSASWSVDWRVSFYLALHLWLAFFFFLSLRDWPEAWKATALGFCAALAFEAITGIVEFVSQSTAFLEPLSLNWPGLLQASTRGASVAVSSAGERILRAYGTFPHPNILGGFILVGLAGPATLFLRKEKPNLSALILLALSACLLALTFSRAAWLGLIAFLAILLWKARYFDRTRLILVIAALLIAFASTLFPLRDLLFGRFSASPSPTEHLSTFGREWLATQALDFARERPLGGVGLGGYIIELAERAGQYNFVEPVHNLFLSTGAELGILGVLLMAATWIAIAIQIVKARAPES